MVKQDILFHFNNSFDIMSGLATLHLIVSLTSWRSAKESSMNKGFS